jgi:phage terminase small subunit
MKQKRPEAVPYPEPPAHLSERSADLWRTLGPLRIDTIGRRLLFEQALRALDSAEAARAAIECDGRTFKTKSGVVHSNPEVKLEIEARRQFASIWGALRLGETIADGFGGLLGS